jgi:hypothetical protein
LIQKQQVDTQEKPNLFANLIQNAPKPSLFSQPASAFNGQQTKPIDQFGQQQTTNNTFFNTFTMNTQNQPTFQTPFQAPTSSIFTQITQPIVPQTHQTPTPTPSFVSPTPQVTAFQTAQSQPGMFTQLVTNKPQQIQQTTQVTTSSYYSSLSDLNENDIKEYKAAQFTLGKVPMLPPAKELC